MREYAYYDAANHTLDFDGMLASLNEAQAGDVVLFHGCCHNPTGIDPTLEQWQQLAQLSVEKGWLPLFDFAYQGFARSLRCIKSCWLRAPTRRTLVCTTNAWVPARWLRRMPKPLTALSRR